MPLKVRTLIPSDYDDTLKGWWKDWGWEAPPRDFLPNDGIGGLMVLDGEQPVCAGFLYLTNSKVSWVDWIISSKTYWKIPERQEALDLLIESLSNACELNGSKYIYALIKHEGLIGTYEKFGYFKGDKYTSEMIKTLN